MAGTITDRIDWYFLGTKLRAIDFHFVWMLAAPESEWLWSYTGLDGGDVLFTGDATREDFAYAAKFVDGSKQFAPVRACDRAHVASQSSRVGQIFISLARAGLATRTKTKGKCVTTLRLPIRGGAQ